MMYLQVASWTPFLERVFSGHPTVILPLACIQLGVLEIVEKNFEQEISWKSLDIVHDTCFLVIDLRKA